jgi:tetratricopeptide (TPR) repeat protein
MLKETIDLHRQGLFDEAEQGYRAQLAAHPDDVDAMHLLGMLRHQRGDEAEGSRLLARALELAPDDANLALSLASLAFRDGDPEAAASGFARALQLDPNLAGAHAGAGQIALLRGEHALAEEHFRIALRANEEPHALAGLGALLLERGDVDGALRHTGRAADLAPQDAMIQLQLGQAFARRDTPAFAEQAFQNALRLRPNLHQARHALGSLLIKARRIPESATISVSTGNGYRRNVTVAAEHCGLVADALRSIRPRRSNEVEYWIGADSFFDPDDASKTQALQYALFRFVPAVTYNFKF